MGENVIIFGADMGSSVHIDNKKKDIIILCEGLTEGLDDTTLTAEAKYPINFAQSRKSFTNSFLFVNATKIYQFKATNSETKKIFFVLMKYFRRFFS